MSSTIWLKQFGGLDARRLPETVALMQTTETEVPPPPRDVFGARQHRPMPYLWSANEICRLLEACRRLRPPLRAATHETLFGLLAVSGMRRGEAIGLRRDDVDLADGVGLDQVADHDDVGRLGRRRLRCDWLGALGKCGSVQAEVHVSRRPWW